jgi:hypothetical protein
LFGISRFATPADMQAALDRLAIHFQAKFLLTF